MSDAPNDTTSQVLSGWTAALRRTDTPFLTALPKGPNPYHRPIIGYTPEKQPQRWIWSRLSRIGHALERRFAQFEYHERDLYDEGPEEYWLKKDWRWVDAIGQKSRAAMPQPIYDPDWVMPESARTMTWGWATPEEPISPLTTRDRDYNYFKRFLEPQA